MKQKLLFSIIICSVLMGSVCMGQVTQTLITQGQNQNTYSFGVSATTYPNIIQHTAPLAGSSNLNATLASNASALAGSRIMWLEYGDGGFTTSNNTTRVLGPLQASSPGNNWFFVSSKLYDNTRDQLRIGAGGPFTMQTFQRTNPSDNDVSILTSATSANSSAVPPRITITPSTYDIVNKDTMCFAITYKFPPDSTKCYYIVFNYNSSNSNSVFQTIANGGNPTNTNMSVLNPVNNTTDYVRYARVFHSESYVSNVPAAVSNLFSNSYTNSVVVKLPICNSRDTFPERNMFFSLVTKDSMAENNTTSINATLVMTNSNNSNPSVVDQHTIAGMAVRPSHDPNYIAQTPVCLQLPKIPRLFNYHLHFQNVGAGIADSVKITLQFTPGFNLNTFNITRGRFSDENYYNNTNNGITHTTKPALNQVILTMYLAGNRHLINPLLGTNILPNPWTSPETMGDIYFNMQATAAVPYFITSQAFIEFRSGETLPPQWETPVATNSAVSTYSNCCDCSLFNCGNSKDSTNRIKKAIPIRKNK